MKKSIRNVNWIYCITVFVYLAIGMVIGVVKNDLMRLLCVQVAIALPSVIYLGRTKLKLREAISLKPISFGTGVLAVLFYILLSPLLTFVNALSMLFAKYQITDEMQQMAQATPLPLMFLGVAVVPAILEEVVYRGVFYHEYRRLSPVAGAVMSGLLFALLHGNLNQFSYAFVLGVAFALLVEATGSIVPTMLIHLCVNGMSVVLLYVMELLSKKSDAFAGLMEQSTATELTLLPIVQVYLIPAIVSTGLAVVVYRELVKLCKRSAVVAEGWRQPNKLHDFMKMITMPLILAALVMIGIMIMTELSS